MERRRAGDSFEFVPTTSRDGPVRYDSPDLRCFAGRGVAVAAGRRGSHTPAEPAAARSCPQPRLRAASCDGGSGGGSGLPARPGSGNGMQQPRPPPLVLGGSPPSHPRPRRASSSELTDHGPALPARQRRRSLDPEAAESLTVAMGTVTVALAASAAALGSAGSPDQVVQRTWEWLAEQPEDAAELAQLLFEATPRLGVAAAGSPRRRQARSSAGRGRRQQAAAAGQRQASLLERLRAAEPAATGSGDVQWAALSLACPSELLSLAQAGEQAPAAAAAPAAAGSPRQRPSSAGAASPLQSPRGEVVEVNSGGCVLLCLLSGGAAGSSSSDSLAGEGQGAQDSHTHSHAGTARQAPAPGQAREQALVVKFHASRLATQAEQFASELTRHLGVCGPACRILRSQGPTAGEWQAAAAAAAGEAGAPLAEQLGRAGSCLVMEFVPGPAFTEAAEPFAPAAACQTAADLARLLLVDMLLGNADRLACRSLGWRGNPSNLRYATHGPLAGRLVAIDAVVQRRPPGGLRCAEDAGCSRTAELALNDAGFAGELLGQALQPCLHDTGALRQPVAVAAFQASLRASLQAALRVKGLLETMFEAVSGWIAAFIADMEALEGGEGWQRGGTLQLSPRGSVQAPASPGQAAPHSPPGVQHTAADAAELLSTTRKIRSIGREARRSQLIAERLERWKATMRERGEELAAAVEDWQAKRGGPGLRLTTGFLDGSQPVVDLYELKVRLEHMLIRLRALQDAAASARPTQLLPHLWLSGAVEAASLHTLRHLGITHLLNATEDLLLPEPDAGFTCLRCALRDEPEVDVGAHFKPALAFIAGARSSGGAVLVHCHEGVSRSVALVLAHLMTSQKWTLKRALEFVTASRPQASPNAGFLRRLAKLEQELTGRRTVQVRSSKPEPRVCPVCERPVGVSSQSLALHMRKAHGC